MRPWRAASPQARRPQLRQGTSARYALISSSARRRMAVSGWRPGGGGGGAGGIAAALQPEVEHQQDDEGEGEPVEEVERAAQGGGGREGRPLFEDVAGEVARAVYGGEVAFDIGDGDRVALGAQGVTQADDVVVGGGLHGEAQRVRLDRLFAGRHLPPGP